MKIVYFLNISYDCAMATLFFNLIYIWYIIYIKIKSYTLAKQYIAKIIAFEILSALAMTLSLAPCAFTSGHTIPYRSLFHYCAFIVVFKFFIFKHIFSSHQTTLLCSSTHIPFYTLRFLFYRQRKKITQGYRVCVVITINFREMNSSSQFSIKTQKKLLCVE